MLEERGLHPLVVGGHAGSASVPSTTMSVDDALSELVISDVDLYFGNRISLYISNCIKFTLVSLIKEVEGALC